jgi:thiol-disulfide isomerase/thioredoxin
MRHRLSFLILLAELLAGCRESAPPAASAPGVVPATPLQTLDGGAMDLPGFLHGRPALVSLWATWCETCIAEAPALNRLDRESRRGGDAVVVGVAIGETRDSVRAFARTQQLDYPQLIDPDFHLADTLGERQVPATLVVDRAGRIVFRGKSLDAGSLAAFRRATQKP